MTPLAWKDGPTHQPVEHLAALRVMPNTFVFRPADAIETLECWQLALKQDNAPSILALTRQGLPTGNYEERNSCAQAPMNWQPAARPASYHICLGLRSFHRNANGHIERGRN